MTNYITNTLEQNQYTYVQDTIKLFYKSKRRYARLKPKFYQTTERG